ncbi:hypothetical protein ACWPKS_08550 [Coraliomargarita sp. W4R72]
MNTSRNYKITVSLDFPMSGDSHAESIEIDAGMTRQFKPFDLVKDPDVRAIAQGVSESEARRIKEDRKGMAKEIAAEMTEVILRAIEKRDTENGYTQNVEGMRGE